MTNHMSPAHVAHDLIRTWHDFLLANDIPMPAGYYSYVEALTETKGYDVVRLGEADLTDLEILQEEVLQTLDDGSWLRANTDVMLKECLIRHVTLGVRIGGKLVGVAVLHDGGETDENIKHYFTDDLDQLKRSINLKLVLALREHRHKGLSRALVELLEREACDLGKTEIMCTIHPKNEPSKALFDLLGYHRVGTVLTTYGKRSVFARNLPVPKEALGTLASS